MNYSPYEETFQCCILILLRVSYICRRQGGLDTVMRAFLIYLFVWLTMSFFGGQICPFLDDLSLPLWSLTLLVGMVPVFLFRFFVEWIRKRRGEQREMRRYNSLLRFIFEFALLLSAGIVVGAFDFIVFGFPFLASGLAAVVMGFGLFGFFAGIDLTLAEERRIISGLKERGSPIRWYREFFPLTRKFVLFGTLSVMLIMLATFFVVSHDLTWLSEQEELSWAEGHRAVLIEIAFITVAFLVFVSEVIYSYALNLKILFSNEIGALKMIEKGDLKGYVPVATNDEFGLIARYTNFMIDSLRARTEEILRTQDVTIHSLAALAEKRDNETGAHILRTQEYVRLLAEELKEGWGLDEEEVALYHKSAPLHDIGKVGVPDSILRKPGPLSEEEWVEMRRHPGYGLDALRQSKSYEADTAFLRVARDIIHSHHERWDGSGYPMGISGEDIPKAARLMALADVYDALTTERVYKEAFSHEKAKQIILESRESHFDPAVVDAFLARQDEFKRISLE